MTTRRSLIRLALVATETASRFAREGVVADPVAWMLSPRRLFGGRSALDACLGREECLRAVLLHGLSIGMDADPAFVDSLAEDDEVDAALGDPNEAAREEAAPPRLWTSFLVDRSDGGSLQAFDAVVARDRAGAEERLRARHGAVLADLVEIAEGFDGSLPLAEALVSPALADMLAQVAADPSSPLAAGLSVSIQQRFAA